jgi:hypothetical protein
MCSSCSSDQIYLCFALLTDELAVVRDIYKNNTDEIILMGLSKKPPVTRYGPLNSTYTLVSSPYNLSQTLYLL